jgi:hypothetical protein
MSEHAVVELRGPAGTHGELILSGICTPRHIKSGPVYLRVSVDGIALPPGRIDATNLDFRLSYPLPPAVIGKSLMMIEVSMDHPVILAGDGRQLGAAFGSFEVTP